MREQRRREEGGEETGRVTIIVQGFIQDFELGVENRISSVRSVKCLLGESGVMPLPQENFEFTSSQIASDTIWDKISKHFDDTYLCSVTRK